MADRGHGWVVLEIGVREDGAVGQQPLDAVRVLRSEPRQVVVAELIDRDEQDEPNVRTGRALRRGWRDGEQDNCGEDGGELLHGDLDRCSSRGVPSTRWLHS